MKIKKLYKILKTYKDIGYENANVVFDNKEIKLKNFYFDDETHTLDIGQIGCCMDKEPNVQNNKNLIICLDALLYGDGENMKMVGSICRAVLNKFNPDPFVPCNVDDMYNTIQLLDRFDDETKSKALSNLAKISENWNSYLLHWDIIKHMFDEESDDDAANKMLEQIRNKCFMSPLYHFRTDK